MHTPCVRLKHVSLNASEKTHIGFCKIIYCNCIISLPSIFFEILRLLQNLFIDIIKCHRRIVKLVQQKDEIHLQICLNIFSCGPISIARFIIDDDFFA